jgi:hypothetical protein
MAVLSEAVREDPAVQLMPLAGRQFDANHTLASALRNPLAEVLVLLYGMCYV